MPKRLQGAAQRRRNDASALISGGRMAQGAGPVPAIAKILPKPFSSALDLAGCRPVAAQALSQTPQMGG